MTKKYKEKSRRTTLKKGISFYDEAPKLINIKGYYLLLLPIKQSTTIRVDCNIFGGNLLESPDDSGIAHILEHILMDSWRKCGDQQCSLYLEKYGIASNASTHQMFTSYWAKSLLEFQNIILNYIFDIIFFPKITQKLIDSEKKIVKNELEGYMNVPSWKLDDLVTKNFYKSNGLRYSEDYKKQTDDLKNITKETLHKYLNRTRLEKCIMFTVSGSFNKEIILTFFNKKFQNVPPSRYKCKMSHFDPSKSCFTRRKRVLYVENKQAQNTEMYICFPTNIFKNNKYSKFLPFVNSIVAGDLTSLIIKRLRIELNLVYGASIFHLQNLCGSALFISIATLDKNVIKVLSETFKIIKKYSETLIPNNTLLHEKRKYSLYSRQISKSNPDNVASFYTHQFFWQLNKQYKQIYTMNELHNFIKKISRHTIQKIIKTIFNTDHCIVGYIGKKQLGFTTDDF